MNKLIDIYCDVGDFCYKFLPVWESELMANGDIAPTYFYFRSNTD